MVGSIFKPALVVVFILLNSCNSGKPIAREQLRSTRLTVPTPTLESPGFNQTTREPTNTPTALPSPTLTATTSPTSTPFPQTMLSSPLERLSLKELPEILTNPFQKPLPGHDDGHHGIDLAFYRRGSIIGIQGLKIHSVFSGKVAGIIINQQPYGNAIIIETNLKAFPSQWLINQSMPANQPTVRPAQGMTCPINPELSSLSSENRSIYLLYAHMLNPPDLRIGEEVVSGNTIGEVGTSGWSVNPHLHLELRIGPGGAKFLKMTHYLGNASDLEMANYCAWRISGLFQAVDPLPILLHSYSNN